MPEHQHALCPACGSRLLSEKPTEGLCPSCVLELALESPSLAVDLASPTHSDTLPYPGDQIAPGAILGGRYRIRALLGQGGMGAVWRAFDLKLRVDVALKALRIGPVNDERLLASLRREVRSAREVVSPHVCRVFDLIEVDGRELVSMEYIDGITLWDILRARAPLELTEAREIALQFLAGLEAIHMAGLVHRDIKPENLMMTRSGRVVVMDFGIAKAVADDESSTVAGTPAYMAPEQVGGDVVSARADVFSAGVVLAEMIAPDGLRTIEARQAIWRGVHRNPPKLPDSPWAPVLTRALAADATARYASASALARALEEVTLRVAEAEAVQPYPGLSAFTEDEAEYFFGRELEIEEMWRKLQRPHLQALIGPSGAGKSSFLRAGLLPVMPTGWRAVVTHPGTQPFTMLAQALIPEFAGDSDAVKDFLRFEDPAVALSLARSWRGRHDQVLLILDQFEELFTQNPPDIQDRFAALVGRLALEADVRVLISMRDDFLFHCSEQPSLAPLFSELTPLRAPRGSALRRAVVEPALKCGYRFEDDALAEEMIAEVAAERGALPLLAFAAARLWDHRDRNQGLLTREAYQHVGGVAGALAQHAERTLERIGQDRLPIVRELFRNLVTAEGTRASRSEEELVSVFEESERNVARHTLDVLVDARLLTSFELQDVSEEGQPQRRIEIIHESLLSQWPRLVRWRTQEADSAQLRDQLRQVARLWVDRGQPEDLLWTGTSFKEFELWKERYAGGLSAQEEAFAAAMRERAQRQRRRRRLALTGAFAILVAVLALVTLFWRQSETARQRADAEARRAEAGKLVALGQLELATYPSATLAYAIKSLELSDTAEGRELAATALRAGPPVTSLRGQGNRIQLLDFSPHGEFLVSSGLERIVLYRESGGDPRELGVFPRTGSTIQALFGRGDVLVSDPSARHLRWQSAPEGDELRAWEWEESLLVRTSPEHFLTISGNDRNWRITRWPFGEGDSESLGPMEAGQWSAVDATDSWIAYGRDRGVYLRTTRNSSGRATPVGEHDEKVVALAVAPDAKTIASLDRSGEIRLWSTRSATAQPIRVLRGHEASWMAFDPTGRWLATHGVVDGNPLVQLWDLRAPHGARALELKRSDHTFANDLAFHPTLPWLVAANHELAGFWPLLEGHPWILDTGGRVSDVEFTPDGAWLLSASNARVQAWPLDGQNGGEPRVLLERALQFPDLAIDPRGDLFAVGTKDGHLMIVPVDGGPSQQLAAFPAELTAVAGSVVAFSPSGSRVAAAPRFGPPEELRVRVWDLQSGETWEFRPGPWQAVNLHFLDENRLLCSAGASDAVPETILYLETTSIEPVAEGADRWLWVPSRDGSFAISNQSAGGETFDLFRTDRASGERQQFRNWGEATFWMALGKDDTVLATAGWDGTVRVGRVIDEAPHLLGAHDGLARTVSVSPDGLWVASGGDDGTVRIWPTPDLSRPPLRARSLAEVLATLRSLTNLRVVEGEGPGTWRLDADPFPGWSEVPSW